MKTYHLKPCTTPANLASDPLPRKLHPNTPAARAAATLTDAIAPAPATPPPLPAPRVLPPRPSPVAAVTTRTTEWALGLIPTVRIGAGVWLDSHRLLNAATPVGQRYARNPRKNPSRTEEKGTA